MRTSVVQQASQPSIHPECIIRIIVSYGMHPLLVFVWGHRFSGVSLKPHIHISDGVDVCATLRVLLSMEFENSMNDRKNKNTRICWTRSIGYLDSAEPISLSCNFCFALFNFLLFLHGNQRDMYSTDNIRTRALCQLNSWLDVWWEIANIIHRAENF